MKRRLIAHTAVCWLLAATTVSVMGIASAQDESPATTILGVAAGTDYLQTGTGTQASLPINGTLVPVTLTGVPIKGTTGPLGNTDTIIQRTQDAVFVAGVAPDTTIAVPIVLQALNLQGTFMDGGNTCTVTITVAASPPSTGVLKLTTDAAGTGGTYTSTITVNYNATVTPGPPTCPTIPSGTCVMTQKGGRWSIKPRPGEFLVTAAYPNAAANQHLALPPGYVDFYISKLQTDSATTARHVVCEAFKAMNKPCP